MPCPAVVECSQLKRIKDLAERYRSPLPEITDRLAAWEAKVNQHLKKMGFKV